MLPAPSAAFATPIAVHDAAALGYEETRIARLFCAAVVVTSAPPPSSTFPAGQLTVAVVNVFTGAFAADVTALLAC